MSQLSADKIIWEFPSLVVVILDNWFDPGLVAAGFAIVECNWDHKIYIKHFVYRAAGISQSCIKRGRDAVFSGTCVYVGLAAFIRGFKVSPFVSWGLKVTNNWNKRKFFPILNSIYK